MPRGPGPAALGHPLIFVTRISERVSHQQGEDRGQNILLSSFALASSGEVGRGSQRVITGERWVQAGASHGSRNQVSLL